MGVEDAKHGEQSRDSMAVLGSSTKAHGHPVVTGHVTAQAGPDSKHGGTEHGSVHDETTTARFGGHGDGSPPNTVAMPITARGSSGAGPYDNTGDELNSRGSLGNTPQRAYNDHPGHERGEGARGKMMAHEKSNYYNDLGGGGEAQSGSGPGEYGKHIEGFGGGHNTFGEHSNFYNEVGDGQNDGEGNSGSGVIKGDSGGKAKTIRGFSADSGLKSGMV